MPWRSSKFKASPLNHYLPFLPLPLSYCPTALTSLSNVSSRQAKTPRTTVLSYLTFLMQCTHTPLSIFPLLFHLFLDASTPIHMSPPFPSLHLRDLSSQGPGVGSLSKSSLMGGQIAISEATRCFSRISRRSFSSLPSFYTNFQLAASGTLSIHPCLWLLTHLVFKSHAVDHHREGSIGLAAMITRYGIMRS